MNHTLLFGNGLNLLNSAAKTDNVSSWNDLLTNLAKKFNTTIDEKTPNTMKYEQIFLTQAQNGPTVGKTSLKKHIAKLMKESQPSVPSKYYSEIIKMNFENYLTTNYDNIFSLNYDGSCENNSKEKLYSLRRH